MFEAGRRWRLSTMLAAGGSTGWKLSFDNDSARLRPIQLLCRITDSGDRHLTQYENSQPTGERGTAAAAVSEVTVSPRCHPLALAGRAVKVRDFLSPRCRGHVTCKRTREGAGGAVRWGIPVPAAGVAGSPLPSSRLGDELGGVVEAYARRTARPRRSHRAPLGTGGGAGRTWSERRLRPCSFPVSAHA